MRTLTLLILIVISLIGQSIVAIGQTQNYCGNSKRSDIEKIKKKFPFNELKTIRLVSFKREKEEDERKTPKTNEQIDFRKMFENVLLSADNESVLLDILFNYNNDLKNEDISWEAASCYEPRNAIVFMDNKGKVLGFVEVCFDCKRYVIEPKSMAIGEFCDEKFDRLKDIFGKSGIKYGLDMTGNPDG
jgi:hypothetical protein